MKGLTLLLLWCCCCSFYWVIQAVEIQPKADTWTRIGENDTIPAGMHVRIDMTTGEKWVKQIDEHDETDSAGQGQQSGSLQVSTNGATASVSSSSERKPNYDYDRMHATLSQLPPEEHERMGGLPELPPPTSTKIDRQRFESRMKEIWEARQAELRRVQAEQMVDLPQVLKNQIQNLQNFVQGQRSVTSITEDLHELEFLLTDVDMARDFYTLQGWPWLIAILVGDQSHPYNGTLLEMENAQASAAWVVGTAVQNTGEFRPWVVEPIMLPNGTVLSALDGLLQVWNDQVHANTDEQYTATRALAQKVLYALSACLRRNPLAQHILHQQGEPSRLLKTLSETGAESGPGRKLILRLLQLGHDLLLEWEEVAATPEIDMESLQAVTEFGQAWTTPEWCQVVLDKARILSRADKRLPILQAWYHPCQTSWPENRVRDLLIIEENGDDVDKDTRVLREALVELLEKSNQ